MSFLGTVRSISETFGVWKRGAPQLGCTIGKVALRETRISAQVVNVLRPRKQLSSATRARLRELFPELDVDAIRVRTGCRLPGNRFSPSGSIYGMTFGNTIYWRDKRVKESDPEEFVKLVHEVKHVDQYRHYGSESAFACAYGEGYVKGDGKLPKYFEKRTTDAYHHNPLEAEAYSFEQQFRDDDGVVVPAKVFPDA